jgi:hypothetical protein
MEAVNFWGLVAVVEVYARSKDGDDYYGFAQFKGDRYKVAQYPGSAYWEVVASYGPVDGGNGYKRGRH